MREKIKCLNGPMEGKDVYIDRRLMKLYDSITIEDDNHNKYIYRIDQNGLSFIDNV